MREPGLLQPEGLSSPAGNKSPTKMGVLTAVCLENKLPTWYAGPDKSLNKDYVAERGACPMGQGKGDDRYAGISLRQ